MSSTSPAKDSFRFSTQFPASLLVQNCLLGFFFLISRQSRKQLFCLNVLVLNASEVCVCPCMHVREMRCISRTLKPNTSFPQSKPTKNASSCPAMRRPCRSCMCREPEQSYPSTRSSAQVCRRHQRDLKVHPGRESEVIRFLQCWITEV